MGTKVESLNYTQHPKMLKANIAIAKQQKLKGVYWRGTDQEGELYLDETAKAGCLSTKANTSSWMLLLI